MADAISLSSNGGRGHVMIAIISTLLPLISVIFGLRLYTRLRLVKSVGLDDWVIFVALVCRNLRA